MAIRVVVDTAKCQSYGRCVAVAPAVFKMGSEGKAQAHGSPDLPQEIILKGVRSCPYRAISAFDEETGQQLFPPINNPGDHPG
jgi:ferredoxin